MADDQFYIQQVPQSLYRNTLDQDSGERKPLNVILAPVKGLSDEQKIQLKEKIQAQIQEIAQALLPEDKWGKYDSQTLLTEIYTKLELL